MKFVRVFIPGHENVSDESYIFFFILPFFISPTGRYYARVRISSAAINPSGGPKASFWTHTYVIRFVFLYFFFPVCFIYLIYYYYYYIRIYGIEHRQHWPLLRPPLAPLPTGRPSVRFTCLHPSACGSTKRETVFTSGIAENRARTVLGRAETSARRRHRAPTIVPAAAVQFQCSISRVSRFGVFPSCGSSSSSSSHSCIRDLVEIK